MYPYQARLLPGWHEDGLLQHDQTLIGARNMDTFTTLMAVLREIDEIDEF